MQRFQTSGTQTARPASDVVTANCPGNMDERSMSPTTLTQSVVRRALDFVSKREFGRAADLLVGIAPLDPRSRYSLGLCQVGAGHRMEGLANVTAALSNCPGLFPWWAPRDTLDLLIDVDRALADVPAGDATVPPACRYGSPSQKVSCS